MSQTAKLLDQHIAHLFLREIQDTIDATVTINWWDKVKRKELIEPGVGRIGVIFTLNQRNPISNFYQTSSRECDNKSKSMEVIDANLLQRLFIDIQRLIPTALQSTSWKFLPNSIRKYYDIGFSFDIELAL